MKELRLTRPESFRQWAGLYGLYMRAFPKAERKPFSMIVKMWKKGKTDIWCVESGGVFLGLGITINGEDTILLDYFAMVEKYRGKGFGTVALKAIMARYEGKRFFLEIENPLEDHPERELRQRRKRFYLAAGLEEMGTFARLFGVEMELLGKGLSMGFDGYKAFYRDNYSQWAADHVTPSGLE